MKNIDLRQEVQKTDLKLWQIADELGVADVTFSKKLKKNLQNNKNRCKKNNR